MEGILKYQKVREKSYRSLLIFYKHNLQEHFPTLTQSRIWTFICIILYIFINVFL